MLKELNENFYSTDTMDEIPVNNISLEEHEQRLMLLACSEHMVYCDSCGFTYLPMSYNAECKCVKCGGII